MTSWMLLGTGCATKTIVKEIPDDRFVRSVRKGEPFAPPSDGKFVPVARWNEMLEVYINASQKK